MILAQLALYRSNKGIAVHVVVLSSHAQEGYFSLTVYRGKLGDSCGIGLAGLTKNKPQNHIGRFSALTAFDEHVQRTLHHWHYTCALDGIYRPTEDAPLAIDIMRAMRIERSQVRALRKITPPISLSDRPTKRCRLLEFQSK